jgi:hypothetical protein
MTVFLEGDPEQGNKPDVAGFQAAQLAALRNQRPAE